MLPIILALIASAYGAPGGIATHQLNTTVSVSVSLPNNILKPMMPPNMIGLPGGIPLIGNLPGGIPLIGNPPINNLPGNVPAIGGMPGGIPLTPEQQQEMEKMALEAAREQCCSQGAWTNWDACSRQCGSETKEDGTVEFGTQSREKRCDLGGRTITCQRQTASCNMMKCYGATAEPHETWWTSWTSCSALCGGGTKHPSAVNPDANPAFVIPCNTQVCEPEEDKKCTNARVILVLDSSASVGRLNWHKLLQTAVDIVKGFPNTVQVGVVTYSTTVNKAIPLAAHDIGDLEEQILCLDWMAGSTNTPDALAAMNEMFTQGSLPSDVTPRVGLLLTDGRANISPEQTVTQALLVKDFPNPVTLYAIGVGSEINPKELISIASVPSDDYVHMSADYDALNSITKSISDEICQAIIRGPIIPTTGETIEEALPNVNANAEITAAQAELARIQAELFGATISAVESVQAAAVAAAVAKAREVSQQYMTLAQGRRQEATNARKALVQLQRRLTRAERKLEATTEQKKIARFNRIIAELRITIQHAEIEVRQIESLASETERIATEASNAAVREATLLEVSGSEGAAYEEYIRNLAEGQAELAEQLAEAAQQTADEAAAALESLNAEELPSEVSEGSDAGPDCSTCVYDLSRGIKLFPDPRNCHRYFVCERIDTPGAPVSYRRHHMECASSTAWDSNTMTCVQDPTCDLIMNHMEEQQGNNQLQGCPNMLPMEGNPSMYIQIVNNSPVPMPCPAGLVFHAELCICDWPQDGSTGLVNPIPPAQDSCLLTHFSFENSFDSPQMLHADQYGNVAFDSAGQTGFGLNFDGESTIKMEFFNNWFSFNHVTHFSVSMWIRPASGSNDLDVQGLLGNGDCQAAPSVQLTIRHGVLSGSVEVGGDALETPGHQVEEEQWQHVSLVYNNQNLSLYVNGQLVGEVQATGPIENRHCALDVGHIVDHNGPQFYYGKVDELSIYKCALTVEEIQDLAGTQQPIAS